MQADPDGGTVEAEDLSGLSRGEAVDDDQIKHVAQWFDQRAVLLDQLTCRPLGVDLLVEGRDVGPVQQAASVQPATAWRSRVLPR